jgi:AAA+ ATPase superfamily predicted ATPase
MPDWGFYGRTESLAELRRIVEAEHWFFCRIEGRRRIGKTTLLGRLARSSDNLGSQLVYMQTPDSDERDVAATFRRSLSEADLEDVRELANTVIDFPTMAAAIGKLCRAGMVVVLDEFQYFTRAALSPFNSFLQAEVDKLRSAGLNRGGLFVLGSLHSEMSALLEDKAAPLYGRITAQLKLDHWEFEDLMSVFRNQEVRTPSQWLTLWTFFEGVPKFYHDAFEQRLFDVPPPDFARELLIRMFVRGSSPLSEEADTWFLRELRGRAVSILHYLADHPGCNHAELVSALNAPHDPKPLGTDITRLVNGYGMVDKLQPVFSDRKSRNARYYISDNFLKAWLAVAKPAREAARLKPIEKALTPALRRLEMLEGFAFEKLIRHLHIEMSRKGRGDFELSELRLGYWNRPRDAANAIEIDLVALDEPNKRIRFGSCKRTASAHDGMALAKFEKHIEAFLLPREHRQLQGWQREKVLFAPEFSDDERAALTQRGYVCRDLYDYSKLV